MFPIARAKFYPVFFLLCLAGYVWLGLAGIIKSSSSDLPDICPMHNIFNIPCPSCGSTRAIFLLLNGDIIPSLSMNPLGLIMGVGLIVFPMWMIFDLITGKNTLLNVYQRSIYFLNRKIIYVPLILLTLINWIWNINKGL